MIRDIKQYVDSSEDGKTWESFFYKSSGPTGVAGRWLDTSMGAGIPKYNAYVGSQLESTALVGTGNDGIYGPNTDRYISRINVQSAAANNAFFPSYMLLCDYLMFYPLVDGDSTDLQEMIVSDSLPRYTDGAGVMCMAVCTTPMTANAVMTVSYTNSAGVSGRTSTSSLIFSGNTGTIVSSSNSSSATGSVSPFIPLAGGDAGIRSIESVQLATPAGGFFALCLVKPILPLQLITAGVCTELFPMLHRGMSPSEVKNGAYLNFIRLANNTTGTSFQGNIQFTWTE